MVDDPNLRKVVCHLQANYGKFTTGVTVNIRQALLHNTEDRGFQLDGKPADSVWQIQIYINSAPLGEPRNKPSDGGQQAHFVEHGGMQQMRQGPHFLQGIIDELPAFSQSGTPSLVESRDVAAQVRE